MTQFEIFEGKDKLWYWCLRVGNGEIVAYGEGYAKCRGAIRACELLRDTDRATPVVYV